MAEKQVVNASRSGELYNGSACRMKAYWQNRGDERGFLDGMIIIMF